jgi:HEAT repeat protein
VEALRGPDPRARKQAALKLGNVGEADPAAFPALRDALRDPDPRVRCEVILALLKCGAQAREVVPSLEQVRRDDRDPQVRSHAARALEALAAGP